MFKRNVGNTGLTIIQIVRYSTHCCIEKTKRSKCDNVEVHMWSANLENHLDFILRFANKGTRLEMRGKMRGPLMMTVVDGLIGICNSVPRLSSFRRQ